MYLLRLGVFIAVAALTIFIYAVRDRVDDLQRFGYPGIFFINVLGSATIILPAPALGIVAYLAGLTTRSGAPVFDPFWLGVAAGLGATIGELSGYAAGFSGQAIVENARLYQRLHDWTRRFGMITIVMLAIIPLPFFDLAGIAAGALKMPLSRFFVATLAGKLIKMWMVAYSVAYSIDWLMVFFRTG
jgi:membrane protein DedA with SNARE-associated domain